MNYTNISIHTDGGARGNPGPAAVGVVIEADGKELHSFGKVIGKTTNNVAEYQAVIEALQYLKKQGIRGSSISFYLDSQLVQRQISGIYQVKQGHLQELCIVVKKLEKEVGERVSYTHIPRAQNAAADKLVNQALDGA